MTNRTAVATLVAAPLLLLAGWAVMKLAWVPYSHSLPWSEALAVWTAGHVFYLAAYVAFVPVILTLGRLVSEGSDTGVKLASGALTALSLVGVGGFVGQMVIDLAVGFQAGHREAMSAVSAGFKAYPGVSVLFYGLVPSLYLAGIVLLVVLAAVLRRVGVAVALAVLLSGVLIGSQDVALMTAGTVGLCLGLGALALALRGPALSPSPS
ncbi:hypothetical protein [Nonomuraea dietziae]|uniref:hypothetical protein n=1 Tax=Nonomuraea dietziae TaxID=65515 RepID=UPI0034398653